MRMGSNRFFAFRDRLFYVVLISCLLTSHHSQSCSFAFALDRAMLSNVSDDHLCRRIPTAAIWPLTLFLRPGFRPLLCTSSGIPRHIFDMCPHIAGNDCGCDRRTDRHTMHRFPRTADSSVPHTGFPVTWREHRVHRFQCIQYNTLGSHWSFPYRPFRTDSGCIRSHIPDTHQYKLHTDSLGSPSLVDVKSDKNSTSRCEITEGQTVCRNGFALSTARVMVHRREERTISDRPDRSTITESRADLRTEIPQSTLTKLDAKLDVANEHARLVRSID